VLQFIFEKHLTNVRPLRLFRGHLGVFFEKNSSSDSLLTDKLIQERHLFIDKLIQVDPSLDKDRLWFELGW
jgi:hypothetical protein